MARVIELRSPTFIVPSPQVLRQALDALAGKGASVVRITGGSFIIQELTTEQLARILAAVPADR